MRIFILAFALLLMFALPRAEIPKILPEHFDEIVEKYKETPLVVSFYVEDCEHMDLTFLPTWEMLYKQLDGDLYRFFLISFSNSQKLAERLGILESPTFTVIFNRRIYYYKGILKNFDTLEEFIKNYERLGEGYDIPTETSRVRNMLGFLKDKIEMFKQLYTYNTTQFFCWLALMVLHIIGVLLAWKVYDSLFVQGKYGKDVKRD